MERRQPASRVGPVIWGTLAFVLVAAIGLSFLLAYQALGDARERAEGRAEEYADTVLQPVLTPETTSRDIAGATYRDLIARVQEGILSDDRVVRVRIWKPDGELIFSTDQRDDVGSVTRPDDPRIEQAAADQTVSTVTEPTVPTEGGLGGSSERLLEIFVPLSLATELSTSGVVQIDHRYEPVVEEVTSFWRPTQIGLAAALGVSLILLAITVWGRRRPEPAPAGRAERPAREAAAAPATEGSRARQAEERAASAERAAREAERKLALVEKRLAEMEDVGTAVSASVAKRVEDLELRLQAGEEERRRLEEEAQRARSVLSRKEAELEQAGAEVQRLVGLLSKRESELAAARQGVQGVEVENERSRDAVSAAEERAAQAERRATDAEAGIATAQQRVQELEARLSAAEERAAHAERRATDAERTAVELEARARAVEGAPGEPGVAAIQVRVLELEDQRRKDVSELQRAQEMLVNTQVELTEANRRLKAAQARISELEAVSPLAAAGAGTPIPSLEEAPAVPPRAAKHRGGRRPRKVAAEETEAPEVGAPVEELAVPAGEPTPEPEQPAEPEEAERPAAEDEEGLSLRERLTRAAAARHRTIGKPDGS